MKVAEYKGLIYEAPPFVPESFWEDFNKLVPLSENQIDRKLRIAWGMDILDYCAGFMERRYGDTDNIPVKYIGRARWVIEGWLSPSVYNKEEWLKDEHLLGAFPESGAWEFVAFHTDNQGGYLPLDQSALNHVQIWAHWQSQSRKKSVEEVLRQKHELWTMRQKERQAAADTLALEFGERVVKHLQTARDVVSTSGANPQLLPPGFSKTPTGIIIPGN